MFVSGVVAIKDWEFTVHVQRENRGLWAVLNIGGN